MPRTTCPFCTRLAANAPIVAATELMVAFEDAYPVSAGHTLIVPRRHIERMSDLMEVERVALWDIVPNVRRWVETSNRPDGYNIGLNDGAAAGQTVNHVHLHVIPRYRGDTRDPRGGVRWVIPERAPYWGTNE